MGTRSCLAMRYPDGSYRATYCHSDGYLSWNGRILMSHYHSTKQAAKLIAAGDASQITEKWGFPHDIDAFWNERKFSYSQCEKDLKNMSPDERAIYDNNPFTLANVRREQDPRFGICRFYKRDRKEGSLNPSIFPDPFATFDDLMAAYDNSWCQYLYLFAGGTWWTDAVPGHPDADRTEHLHLLYDALVAHPGDEIAKPVRVGPDMFLRRRAVREGYRQVTEPVSEPVAARYVPEISGRRRPIAI